MILDQKAIEEKWARQGFSCGLWVDPPGQRWEGFVHDVDEVVYVVEGTMEFEIDGKVHVLDPGNEAFIPAEKNHSARNVGGETARWYYGYRRKK